MASRNTQPRPPGEVFCCSVGQKPRRAVQPPRLPLVCRSVLSDPTPSELLEDSSAGGCQAATSPRRFPFAPAAYSSRPNPCVEISGAQAPARGSGWMSCSVMRCSSGGSGEAAPAAEGPPDPRHPAVFRPPRLGRRCAALGLISPDLGMCWSACNSASPPVHPSGPLGNAYSSSFLPTSASTSKTNLKTQPDPPDVGEGALELRGGLPTRLLRDPA